MEQNQEQKQPKKTASQRIDELEQALMSLYGTADNMARDLSMAKEAIKLLGNKLDSVVKAISRGENITDEVISKIMVENNVEELKQKTNNLVGKGMLEVSEEVTLTSFVVGREINEDGIVMNPRMQFVLSTINSEVQKKFLGAKVGQLIEVQEGKWQFEIIEIYNIVEPKVEVPPEVIEQENLPKEETVPEVKVEE